jgi:hypothetical protein
MSEHFTNDLAAKVESHGKKMYVDQFEKLQYLSQKRLDNSIWISPIIPSHMTYPEYIWKFFQ